MKRAETKNCPFQSYEELFKLRSEIQKNERLLMLCKKFSTYESAIEEILRLSDELASKSLKTQKRRRGRPSKDRLEVRNGFFGIFNPQNRLKKPTGAPLKYTRQEKIEIVQSINNDKETLGFKTDKQFWTAIINAVSKNEGTPQYKKKEYIDRNCKELKYFRDQTGIRQKSRKLK